MDELGSGLLVLLAPALRARLGLSLTQLGWCLQALATVAAVVEPLTGAAVDRHPRRPLLVWGAVGWGCGLLLAGTGSSFAWLLAAFAVVGAASGPLTATADVALVEAHPRDQERIASRSTLVDTTGALLAPAVLAAVSWAGLDGRPLLLVVGAGSLGYALALRSVRTPPAPRAGTGAGPSDLAGDVVAVLRDRQARDLIVALLLLEILDVAELFEPVWLVDVAGASTATVGLHATLGTGASLGGLVLLDRVLAHHDGRRVVLACGLLGTALYAAWLLTPGVAAKLVLVVPRELVLAPLWPVIRARALAAVPERAGTVAGLTAVLGLLPVAGAFAVVAQRAGLTRSLLVLHLVASLVLVAVVRRRVDPTEADRS